MGMPAMGRIVRFFMDQEHTKQFYLYQGRPARIKPEPARAFCNQCNAEKPNDWVGQKCLDCGAFCYQMPTSKDITPEYVMKRYPRIVAHVIAGSLGYATPSCAARIVADAIKGQKNWCEWVGSCYKGDAKKCISHQIYWRRNHNGYMASYGQAIMLTASAMAGGPEPEFASWF